MMDSRLEAVVGVFDNDKDRAQLDSLMDRIHADRAATIRGEVMTETQWRVCWEFTHSPLYQWSVPEWHYKWTTDAGTIQREHTEQKDRKEFCRVWIEEREVTYSAPRVVGIEEVV